MKFRALAPGKVNLSLFLGPVTRLDGRHELVTLLESLSLADTITATTAGKFDRVLCPGVDGVNLAATALVELRSYGWDGPPVTFEIDKRIPVAAGMAGGSADAAAALRLALAISPVPAELVDEIARALGSDVPSQLTPGLSFATGAGEIVQPLPALADHAFVVVPSEHELSTAEVYREADRMELCRSLDELERLARELPAVIYPGSRLPAQFIVNDLQPAAVSLCPSIGLALGAVLAAGAAQAIVSGSGPTVVGIWWGKDAAMRAASAAQTLAKRYAGAVVSVPVSAQFGAPEKL